MMLALLTVLFLSVFKQVISANKWDLVPYCETQAGNMIFGMKIISTKNKEWRRITPRDVIQVQRQDSAKWVAYRYDGTVLDKNGEYIVRLKHRLQNRNEEALYYCYPRRYKHSSLESKLNDGSIRVRLQDGITKQYGQDIDPHDLDPQQHFWVSDAIDVFGTDILKGKKAAESDRRKREAWRPLKIEQNVVAKSVNPKTGEVNQNVIDIKPNSYYYPKQVNHCTQMHEKKKSEKDKREEVSTVTYQTDDEEIVPLRSNNAAYDEYDDMLEDDYYEELVEEMESLTQRAYRRGFYSGYRDASKMQK